MFFDLLDSLNWPFDWIEMRYKKKYCQLWNFKNKTELFEIEIANNGSKF